MFMPSIYSYCCVALPSVLVGFEIGDIIFQIKWIFYDAHNAVAIVTDAVSAIYIYIGSKEMNG